MNALKESFNQPQIEFTKSLGLTRSESPAVSHPCARLFIVDWKNNFYRKKPVQDIQDSYEFDFKQFKRKHK